MARKIPEFPLEVSWEIFASWREKKWRICFFLFSFQNVIGYERRNRRKSLQPTENSCEGLLDHQISNPYWRGKKYGSSSSCCANVLGPAGTILWFCQSWRSTGLRTMIWANACQQWGNEIKTSQVEHTDTFRVKLEPSTSFPEPCLSVNCIILCPVILLKVPNMTLQGQVSVQQEQQVCSGAKLATIANGNTCGNQFANLVCLQNLSHLLRLFVDVWSTTLAGNSFPNNGLGNLWSIPILSMEVDIMH